MVVGLKSPWRASSLEWATSCHVREKMRSFSWSRTTGSRYMREGSVCARATLVSSFICGHILSPPHRVGRVGWGDAAGIACDRQWGCLGFRPAGLNRPRRRERADRGCWQVQVHAIGDRAIRVALDAFAGCDAQHRHRIEHIETPAAADTPRFAELGVIASMQPQHADTNLTSVWQRNLGAERSVRGWPWRVLLASGARLAFGTDWPVVPLDPFASLQIATEDHAAQRIGIEQAVAAWTSGAAYAEPMEKEKGLLKAGIRTDITVLHRH